MSLATLIQPGLNMRKVEGPGGRGERCGRQTLPNTLRLALMQG